MLTQLSRDWVPEFFDVNSGLMTRWAIHAFLPTLFYTVCEIKNVLVCGGKSLVQQDFFFLYILFWIIFSIYFYDGPSYLSSYISTVALHISLHIYLQISFHIFLQHTDIRYIFLYNGRRFHPILLYIFLLTLYFTECRI